MILSIMLRNFQRHKKLLLKLGPEVTTIVGPTDRGKSSVLRALRLLATNKPSGDRHIRHGATKSMVGVKTDKNTVSRIRTKRSVQYVIDGEVYAAAGNGPPPAEVLKALELLPENFQRQSDPPFWFFEPAGQVSRALNEFVSLGSIDKALDGAARLVRNATNGLREAKGALKAAEERKESLAWVPRMAAASAALEQSKERADKSRNSRAELASLIERGKPLFRLIKRGREAIRAGGIVLKAGGEARSSRLEREALEADHDVMESARARMVACRPGKAWKHLQEVREVADIATSDRQELELSIATASNLSDELCQLRKEKKRLQSLLLNPLFGKVCPTCGQPRGQSASTSPTFTLARKRPNAVRPRTGMK